MKEKVIRWAVLTFIIIWFIFFSVTVKFALAISFTLFLMAIISSLFLVLKYQVAFAKYLLISSFFILCCTLGHYWGAKTFWYSMGISVVGGLFLWIVVADPDKQEKKVNTTPKTNSFKIAPAESKTYYSKNSTANSPNEQGLLRSVEQFKSAFTKSQPYFAGKGTKIELGGYIINDPMTYIVDSKTYEDYDASLLCLRRLIAPPQLSDQRTLPYWPRLSDTDASQLGDYINWMATGKKDSHIELGYVFIYFYGLERRSLVERKDLLDVGNEVIRLLKVYNYSGSFRQYATGLIIHLIQLGIFKPTEKIIDALLNFQQGHLSDAFQSVLLEYLAKNNLPMSPRWAISFAKQNQRTIRSVVLDRAYEEFCKLFTLRYDDKYLDKMVPRMGDRAQIIEYHVASPSLSRGMIPSAEGHTIIDWNRQFSPVITLFNECIEELKAYSRKTTNYPEDKSIAFESLPPELQDEMQHPQQKDWEAILENYTDSLIPIEKIALLRKIEHRQRLSLGQSKSIARLIESLGSSVEPDPRYTEKSFSWDDYVSILRLPDEPSLPQGPNYSLVSLLLPLAVEVSCASGSLEEREQQIITEFFQERFMLTRNDRLRLAALIQVTLKNGTSYSGIKKRLLELFEENQRKSIGKFLVMIAGAVDGICTAELKALEKTFNSLGIDKQLLNEYIIELGYQIPEQDRLVVKGTKDAQGEAIPPRIAILDIDKIRKIHDDSIEASKLLINAMNSSEKEKQFIASQASCTKTGEVCQDKRSINISDRIKPFFDEMIKKQQWLHEDISKLAQIHNVTVSAAMEEINTWADENLGDFLIDEGNPMIVNRELLARIGVN
jgi:uncharacterized tellurite resistance protein B-like protein